jgi:hypothetical protein
MFRGLVYMVGTIIVGLFFYWLAAIIARDTV